jgi:hypothetical protein
MDVKNWIVAFLRKLLIMGIVIKVIKAVKRRKQKILNENWHALIFNS